MAAKGDCRDEARAPVPNSRPDDPGSEVPLPTWARVCGCGLLALAVMFAVFESINIPLPEFHSEDTLIDRLGNITGYVVAVGIPALVAGFVFTTMAGRRPRWHHGLYIGLVVAAVIYVPGAVTGSLDRDMAYQAPILVAMSTVGGLLGHAVSRLLMRPRIDGSRGAFQPWHLGAIISALAIAAGVAWVIIGYA